MSSLSWRKSCQEEFHGARLMLVETKPRRVCHARRRQVWLMPAATKPREADVARGRLEHWPWTWLQLTSCGPRVYLSAAVDRGTKPHA